MGYGEGQESLTCCSPWGYKELDTTERLNNKRIIFYVVDIELKFVHSLNCFKQIKDLNKSRDTYFLVCVKLQLNIMTHSSTSSLNICSEKFTYNL